MAPEPAVIEVPGAASMRALGERLAARLRPGDLVVLSGPLGAGKTTLVQGIGAGLRVRGPVTSPTFVIARVHQPLGDGPALVHADAYRLGSRIEVDDLDLDADMSRSVTVVEWGEGLVEDLAPDYLQITISRPRTGDPDAPAEPGDELRLVTITGRGDRWIGGVAAELSAVVVICDPSAWFAPLNFGRSDVLAVVRTGPMPSWEARRE